MEKEVEKQIGIRHLQVVTCFKIYDGGIGPESNIF